MKTYQWLFFDLDNTLLDFDRTESAALRMIFEQLGVSSTPSTLKTYHEINEACWDDFEEGRLPQEQLNELRFQRFMDAVGLKGSALEVGDRYLDILRRSFYPVDHAIELLNQVAGRYQLAVITNGLKKVQRPRLEYNRLTHYFEAITVSEEIGKYKPNADFFEHALAASGRPPKEQVLVIGDSLRSDIKGGNDYGLDTCWFNSKSRTLPGSIRPTYEIHHLPDLLQILQS